MHHFQVSQTLKMVVPNDTIPIGHYLRQPQRLVQAITDSSQIKQLSSSHFRLQLRPLQFMMLRLEPTVDLKVWTDAEGMLHLRSLDCEIHGTQWLPPSFRLELAGTLFPHHLGSTTELRGQAELKVQVEVPPPLKLLPEPILNNSGQGFLNGILLTIKYRLERQLLKDYRRWVEAKLAEPEAPLPIPVGNPAS